MSVTRIGGSMTPKHTSTSPLPSDTPDSLWGLPAHWALSRHSQAETHPSPSDLRDCRGVRPAPAAFRARAQGEQEASQCYVKAVIEASALPGAACHMPAHLLSQSERSTLWYQEKNEPWTNLMTAKAYGSLPGNHGRKVVENCWNGGFCHYWA